MSTSILLAMLCIGVIVIAATVALVYLLTHPKGNINAPQKLLASEPQKQPKRNWQIWILYFGIAIVLAIWTIWGALFFLAIAWVLRTNPSPDASFTLNNNDKKTARRIYTWLFLSSIITVPIFISAASNIYNSTINECVLTALLPLILHIPLLLGLTSKSAFIYRHTQQGLLLIALRAGMAGLTAINVEDHIDYALLIFFFGNGSLWLIGSLIGWSQITNNKCWFMDRRGEKLIIAHDGIENLPAQKHIEQSREFIQRYKADDAKKHALAAFRSGDREIKSQAVKLLETLDEVEQF